MGCQVGVEITKLTIAMNDKKQNQPNPTIRSNSPMMPTQSGIPWHGNSMGPGHNRCRRWILMTSCTLWTNSVQFPALIAKTLATAFISVRTKLREYLAKDKIRVIDVKDREIVSKKIEELWRELNSIPFIPFFRVSLMKMAFPLRAFRSCRPRTSTPSDRSFGTMAPQKYATQKYARQSKTKFPSRLCPSMSH